jgi:hypothetical protein
VKRNVYKLSREAHTQKTKKEMRELKLIFGEYLAVRK